MKLVHAADLHLDSPLLGLERYDGAPVHRLRNATREAFENLVKLCIDESAALLLLAGDLYDGNWRDYSTGLFFAAGMSKLRRAGVRVVWIRGNHDAASQIAKNLELPPNVRELDHKRPDTVTYEEIGVVVHGQGFATREVRENLARTYPNPRPGLFNIGMLHTSVTGRPGHDPYAPCTTDDLRERGYEYWALGHVHQREELSCDPWMVFPGNLQGRHARECGGKGATVVTVEDLRVRAVEHRVLDSVRWAVCEIDVSDCASPHEVLAALERSLAVEHAKADTRLLAARVVVSGQSGAHAALAREPARWLAEARLLATDLGGDDIWLEKMQLHTRDTVPLTELRARDDAVGQVFRGLAELRGSDAELSSLSQEFGELANKLPLSMREGPDSLRLDDPETLRRALDEVEQLLLPRLVGGGDE
ncbi:MAG: DNA repair exonuclease [Polyangiaceae bacterium]|nr:DNA repair exonuclease [Polyangiaceae bacterium]